MVERPRQRLHGSFQPFVRQRSNDRKFNVPHRDFIALASRVAEVLGENEASHTINPLHIVSIKDLEPRP